MNEELYELAKKHLEALNAEDISDIEVRHVKEEFDEYGRISIEIYYK